ncbi:MAG: O-antigen ligase family protein [Erysipelotrichaceae bacterium]
MRKIDWWKEWELVPIYLFAGISIFTRFGGMHTFDFSFVNWFPSVYQTLDYSNFYKSFVIIIATVLALVTLLVQRLKRQKTNGFNVSMLFVLTFALLIGVSYVLCDPQLQTYAWNGYFTRYEGTLVWFCYLFFFFYIYLTIRDFKRLKKVLWVILACMSIGLLIGLSQVVGMDVFALEWVQRIQLPKELHVYIQPGVSSFPGMVYSVFANPNYVSFFLAMVMPLLTYVTLTSRKATLFWYGVWFIALLNLFGSKSISGILAFALTLVIALGFLWSYIVAHPKRMLGFFLLGSLVLGLQHEWLFAEFGLFQEPSEHTLSMDDLSRVVLQSDGLLLTLGEQSVRLTYDENAQSMRFFADGEEIIATKSDAGITLDKPYETFVFQYYPRIDEEAFGFVSNKENYIIQKVDGNYHIYNGQGVLVPIVNVASIGFEHHQKFGSGRGYIWSKSLPLLADTLWYGHGADTYAFYFPQNDVIGKIPGFASTPYIHVDKPHNIYLQLAIHFGVIAMLCFVGLLCFYWYTTWLRFRTVPHQPPQKVIAWGIAFSLFGFAIAGLMNDTSVHVMPVFFTLLALGFVCNKIEVHQD